MFGGREYLQDTDLTLQVVQWDFSHIINFNITNKKPLKYEKPVRVFREKKPAKVLKEYASNCTMEGAVTLACTLVNLMLCGSLKESFHLWLCNYIIITCGIHKATLVGMVKESNSANYSV